MIQAVPKLLTIDELFEMAKKRSSDLLEYRLRERRKGENMDKTMECQTVQVYMYARSKAERLGLTLLVNSEVFELIDGSLYIYYTTSLDKIMGFLDGIEHEREKLKE